MFISRKEENSMLLRNQRARVKTAFISIKDKSIDFFKSRTRISKSSDWDVDPQKVIQVTFMLYLILMTLSKSPAWSIDETEYYIHQAGRVPIDGLTRKALTADLVHVNMRCLVRKHLNEGLKGGFNQRQIDRNELWMVKLVKNCVVKTPRNCYGVCVNSFRYFNQT